MAKKSKISKTLGETSLQHGVLLVLVALNLVVSIITLTAAMRPKNYEALKVGGTENLQKIQNLYESESYIQQQTQNIDQLADQIGALDAVAPTDTPEPAPTPEPTAQNDDTTEESTNDDGDVNQEVLDAVAAMKEDGYFKGDTDARFILVEYSDIECPFCKRHHDQGTIQQFMDANPGEIATTFRHFPLNFHPNAQKAGEAAECVAEQEGSDAYYEFIDLAFASQNNLAVDNLKTLASQINGVNESNFNDCIDNGDFAAKVRAQMSEGQQLFGVSGTPGNVLIDTTNGEFRLIAGAFPVSRFQQELDALKNN